MFVVDNRSSQSSLDSSSDPLIENNSNEDERTVVNPDSSPSSRVNMNNTIISYGKELLCIVAFILTTMASIQSNSPKISRTVAPVPFFSKGSLVEDYYRGQLSATQTKVSLSDLSFVLYYAPWCSESQHARAAFEHVARLFYREAYFSAINCWQPGSECRNQYQKIHSWPILMAYQRNGFGVQYQKNLWTDGALTKFITSLLNPIQRLTTPDDLLEMMTSKDGIVVAFIDLQTHPRQYRSFYHAALKYLERDPFNEIGFAVVTGETSLSFGVDRVPAIRAYLWNETIEYFGNASWSSKEINKWVNDQLQQVSINLSPPGSKSSSLSPYLKQGPVMILFTPRNFYTELSDPYVMLQQIGMEYYNCGGDNWVQEMARDYLFERRKENRGNHQKLFQQCQSMFDASFTEDPTTDHNCDSPSVSFGNVLNSTKTTDTKFKNLPNFCELPKSGGKCGCQGDLPHAKQHIKYSYEANKKDKKFETSMLDNEGDHRSPEAIEKYNFRRKCEMLRLSEKKKSEVMFIDDHDMTPLELVSGLACKSNRTFTLVAIDSISFHTFAERLGIEILEVENKSAAIIMDMENESTYLLDEPINLDSLTRFLFNFHRRSLNRFLRTNSVQSKHTHFFNMNDFLSIKMKEKMNTRKLGRKKCETDTAKQKIHSVVLTEINSEDFDEIVVRSNKTVAVVFYSANCAFCSMMTHSLLTVTRILENVPDIDFVRIDGEKNDLSWQFTVSEYPTLIIFPAAAKAESRKFPSGMQINATNVLGFVLANLNRSQRLLGLVMACNYKRINSTNDCITTIQEEITENVSYLLREWRNNPRRRGAVLRIIKQLKAIYLKLFAIKSSCDFLEVEKDVRLLMERWQKSVRL